MARKPKPDQIPVELQYTGGNSMASIIAGEDHFLAASTSDSIIAAHAQFMFPDQAKQYHDWAATNPTMNVQTWAPLIGYVSPFEKPGKTIAYGDVQAQSLAGTIGANAAVSYPGNLFPTTPSGALITPTGNGTPIPPTPTPATPPTAVSANAGMVPDGLNPLSGITSGLGDAASWVGNFIQGASRGAIVLGSSAYDYVQGLVRGAVGSQQRADDIAKKYGLNDQERRLLGALSSDPGSATDTPIGTSLPYGTSEVFAGAADKAQEDNQAEFDALPSDRRDLVNKAIYEYETTQAAATGAKGTSDSAIDSTLLGQAAAHPELLFGGGPEATGFIPSNKLNELADAHSASVADIPLRPDEARRQAEKIQQEVFADQHFMPTLDQALAVIRPIAWTPGRAVLHQYSDVDTTAFNFWSGVIDAGTNLALDPVNLLPVPKGGNVVSAVARHVPGTLAQALTVGGESAVLTSRIGTVFGKAGQAGTRYSVAGVPDAFRGQAAIKVVEDATGNPLVRHIDPSVPTSWIDDSTGAVNGPKVQTVIPERAWNWLNGAAGQRAVQFLTNTQSAAEIILRSNRKMDPEVAGLLADATTTSQVRAILASRMGIDITKPSEFGSIARRPMPSIFGPGPMQDGFARQAFRVAPRAAQHIDLNRTEDAFYQLEAWSRGIGMKISDVIPHLDRFLAAKTDLQRYSVIYGRRDAAGRTLVPGLVSDAADHLMGDVTNLSDDEVALRKTVVDHLMTAFDGGLDGNHRNWMNADLGADTFGAAGKEGDIGAVLGEHENLSRTAILPDYRQIKRYQGLADKFARMLPTKTEDGLKLNKGMLDRPLESALPDTLNFLGDGLQNLTSTWRNLVLVRPAFIAREMIDLSVAMSLGGYRGPMTHPIQMAAHGLSAALAKDSASLSGQVVSKGIRGTSHLGLTQLRAYLEHRQGMAALAPHVLTSQARITGEGMWDSWNKFQQTGDWKYYDEMFDGLAGFHGNFNVDQGRARLLMRYTQEAARDMPGMRGQYLEALAQRIASVSRDRDMRHLAGAHIEDPLNPGTTRAMTDDEIMAAFRDGNRQRKMEQRPDLLSPNDPALDQKYLDGYRQILQRITGDHPELMDAIATGHFNGEPLLKTHNVTSWKRANPDFTKHLAGLMDDEDFVSLMPKRFYVPQGMNRASGLGAKFGQVADEFFALTGDMSDMMVRAPILREAYQDRVLRMIPMMTPQAKLDIVANLRKAGDVKFARSIMDSGPARGLLDVKDVEGIATTWARKESQRLFYDATKRQNYAYAMRVISPFLQATTNTFRRWGAFSLENPQMMYRTIKPIYYGQQPGSAVIYDAMAKVTGSGALDSYYTPARPDQSVNGFFYQDENGDRRFAYPMQSQLMAMLGMGLPSGVKDALGSTVAMTGTLGGLNVAGQSLNAGAGPAVTLPASFILDGLMNSHSTMGDLARSLFPYNVPEGNVAEKIFGSLLPTAFQKLNSASSDDTLVANMAMKMMPSLEATGHYNLHTEAGKRQMVNDAQELASRLYVISAVGGMIAPAQMSGTAFAEVGPENAKHLMVVSELAKEFRLYQANTPDYFAAVEAFVHDRGDTALLSVMPRSRSDAPQATNDVWVFKEHEPTAYQSFRTVLGYFFAGGDGTFDNPSDPLGYAAPLARAQRSDGDRGYLTPEEYIDSAQNSLGWMLFNARTREIATKTNDPTEIADLTRAARQDIWTKYPHWTGLASNPGASDTKIRDIKEALQDPAIASLTSAKYLGGYIQARDHAFTMLEKEGIHSLTSQAAIDTGIPAQLLQVGHQMIALDTTGSFARTWNALFRREIGA